MSEQKNGRAIAEAMVCVSGDAIGIGLPDGSVGTAVKVVEGVDLANLRERWVRYIAGVIAMEATDPAPEPAEQRAQDRNVEAVVGRLRERSRAGLAKYGVTTERGDLTLVQWLQHLQEELLDAAIYVERVKGLVAGIQVAPGAQAEGEDRLVTIGMLRRAIEQVDFDVSGKFALTQLLRSSSLAAWRTIPGSGQGGAGGAASPPAGAVKGAQQACVDCGGTGATEVNGVDRTCSSCRGTGVVKL